MIGCACLNKTPTESTISLTIISDSTSDWYIYYVVHRFLYSWYIAVIYIAIIHIERRLNGKTPARLCIHERHPISRPQRKMTAIYRQRSVLQWPRQKSLTFLVSPADGTNFALFHPAFQSTTYGNGRANIAVDGITKGDGGSHTKDGDYHPWWMVHLAYPIWVTDVEITNRIRFGQQMLKNQLTGNNLSSFLLVRLKNRFDWMQVSSNRYLYFGRT